VGQHLERIVSRRAVDGGAAVCRGDNIGSVSATQAKPRTYAEVAKLAAPALLVTLLAFGLAYYFVGPAPPDRIAIATGERDGAYYHFAERYREVLAGFGVDLEVRPTAGSAPQLIQRCRGDPRTPESIMPSPITKHVYSGGGHSMKVNVSCHV